MSTIIIVNKNNYESNRLNIKDTYMEMYLVIFRVLCSRGGSRINGAGLGHGQPKALYQLIVVGNRSSQVVILHKSTEIEQE